MLRNVEIKVDLDSLNKSINITGIIYFEIDFHRYYPDEYWSDFVVIILSWWIKSMKALILSKKGRTYEFDFMDGSPVVLAKKISNEEIELSCYDEDIVICNIKQLRDSLLSTSKKVLRDIERKKWESDEIEELRSLTISLERYPF
ncbi:hypothetical protein [Bacillus sp. OAE603]|uniref:hypothetical protein n=1 Tax=Gottfriedia sp. OAE603 TaxID=2663872 RepID=UPI00178969F4